MDKIRVLIADDNDAMRMIERKMRNNAIRNFPKDYNTMAKRSILQTDEVYRANQAEIEANANTEELAIEGEVIEETPFQ